MRIVNARHDDVDHRPTTVLPSLRAFVLASFAANDIAAQPILYRRV